MNKFTLIDELKLRLEDVSRSFNSIQMEPIESLLYKRDIKKWSAIECIEHLNITSRFYFPQINRLIEQSNESYDKDERLTSNLFGKMMIKSMTPKENAVVFKMKTFDRFVPPVELECAKVLEEFENQLNTFEDIVDFMRRSKVKNLKVNSALGPIIKFKFSDAVHFLIAHMERHLIQARNEIYISHTNRN